VDVRGVHGSAGGVMVEWPHQAQAEARLGQRARHTTHSPLTRGSLGQVEGAEILQQDRLAPGACPSASHQARVHRGDIYAVRNAKNAKS